MKKKLGFYFLMAGLLSVFMASGIVAAQEVVEEETVVESFEVKEFIKTADNFIVLFDSSSSMNKMLEGTNMTRIQMAKKMLMEQNKSLPDLGYMAGLYTFSPFKPVYPMKAYNKRLFGQAIDSLPDKGKGATPLQDSLRKLDSVLSGLPGRTAIFTIYDGVYTYVAGWKTPYWLAKGLAEKYDVFFYVIDIEKDTRGDDTLKSIASVNEWSRVVPIEELINRPETSIGALYVINPKTIEITRTVSKVVGFNVDNILFDFNSADIRSESHDELDSLAGFLEKNSSAYVILTGHTDNVGSEEYNMGLSRRRAESVENYLTQNSNVEMGRIITQWYGKLAPAADNATAEGRNMNRRVESVVLGLN